MAEKGTEPMGWECLTTHEGGTSLREPQGNTDTQCRGTVGERGLQSGWDGGQGPHWDCGVPGEDHGRTRASGDPTGGQCSWGRAPVCCGAVGWPPRNQRAGHSSLTELSQRFLEGSGSLVPFQCCHKHALVAPDKFTPMDASDEAGAVQTQPQKPALVDQD